MISLLVVAVFGSVVYLRAHRLARASLEKGLLLQAESLAGLLEIHEDGIEFEPPAEKFPGFGKPGSGSYAVIYDEKGAVVVRSPSLGGQALPLPRPLPKKGVRFERLDPGPDGIPCTMITLSFPARVEHKDGEGREAADPEGEARPRYVIQVARDRREEDERLGHLALFLVLAGAGVLVVMLGAGLLLGRLALRPVRLMTEAAGRLTPEDPSRRLDTGIVLREFRSLADTLNSALDRLARALDRQRRFTSEASHELRTPVSVLLGNTEYLLRKPRSSEEYREGLELQLRTIRGMKKITEDLLILARADASRDDLERKPVRLSKVLARACEEVNPLALQKGIRLECEPGPDLAVLGDGEHLGRLVLNLLSNALKFTPEGGRVRAELAARDGEAVLSVSDTGPGIPPEHRSRLFERFHRVHEGRDPNEGSGLGLAIADWIARAHGGRIEVESEPGRGSVFRVRLALVPAD